MNDASGGHPREQLSSYMDDELGVEERGAIDRHLADCEDCRGQLEALRRIARALADESVPLPPVDLAARIGRRLDGGASVRPRSFRFAVPVSIAATLGAIGILVALQWREGRLGAPVPPAAPPAEPRATDTLKSVNAPAKDAAVEAPRADRKERKKIVATPAIEPEPEPQLQPQAAGGGAPAGIIGGVEGGVPDGVPGGVQIARERDFRTTLNESVQQPAPAAAAKSEARSLCAEHWSDSGARGTWVVTDIASAVQILDKIARDVSGIGQWHGADDGRPYMLVVPRGRFEEVYYALRARGVSGLDEPPGLPEGSGCAGVSVTLTLAAPR